jgi:guanylate kinase
LEEDGTDYHFISLEEAETMLDSHAYVEAKMYSGNVYGTSVAEIQAAHDANKIATTDIEVQGVAEYMAIDPNIHAVFILPPSYKVWQERLVKRYGGAINQADFEKRMHTALRELEHALNAPYFHFVVSSDLDQTVKQVDNIANSGKADKAFEEAARTIAHQLVHDISS